MRRKKELILYIGMWLISVLLLSVLLWQNVGDARIINYGGIVRGATQKLVKEELTAHPDDALIARLDGIIYDLRTGKGDYDLRKSGDEKFQSLLNELEGVWGEVKTEIGAVRAQDPGAEARLYALSQRHFEVADRMVLSAEQFADRKLTMLIVLYFIGLAVSVAIFVVVNLRGRKALARSIYRDHLTQILNRAGFEDAAGRFLKARAQDAAQLIAELDLDRFKSINNTFGFVNGDRLLSALATALSGRADTLCARIDADDFVVLMPDSETAIDELRALAAAVVKSQSFLEGVGNVTFTIGAYRITEGGESVKTVMDKANTAHKTAKAERVDLVWYDDNLVKKLELENFYNQRFGQALTDREFRLYLQPKLDLADMSVMGAEALVRWAMPDGTLVYPENFIPLFEKSGTIGELDYYMLDNVCAYLRNRIDEGRGELVVSVNFSRVTLCQRDFYTKFTATVARYGLPHRLIEVEVTESAFNDLAESVIQTLITLRADGFLLSMDDFGAGYSNLNMLGRLPVQILKLDREFLQDLHDRENVGGIIVCAVELAHALGIKIICEGVEQPEQVDFLRRIGCDYAQGYLVSQPIPQEQFDRLPVGSAFFG